MKNKKIYKKKNGIVTSEALVLDCLPNNIYKVKIKNFNDASIAYLKGNMIKNHIKLMKDDIVIVEFSYLNYKKCRVIYRKNEN